MLCAKRRCMGKGAFVQPYLYACIRAAMLAEKAVFEYANDCQQNTHAARCSALCAFRSSPDSLSTCRPAGSVAQWREIGIRPRFLKWANICFGCMQWARLCRLHLKYNMATPKSSPQRTLYICFAWPLARSNDLPLASAHRRTQVYLVCISYVSHATNTISTAHRTSCLWNSTSIALLALQMPYGGAFGSGCSKYICRRVYGVRGWFGGGVWEWFWHWSINMT